MNEREEKQWLYAKSLEIAALIQGPYKEEITKQTAPLVIQSYDPLVRAIARRIHATGKSPEIFWVEPVE